MHVLRRLLFIGVCLLGFQDSSSMAMNAYERMMMKKPGASQPGNSQKTRRKTGSEAFSFALIHRTLRR
jgi:hypothetical protein